MYPSNQLPDKTQKHLLVLAAGFLIIYSTALTLSAAARMRSWQVSYRWEHWLLIVAWGGIFILAHRATARWLPERDPYLLPLAALLTGWGTLTIWRLGSTFGLRQTAWLVVVVGVFILGLRMPSTFTILRKYKYIWLSGGLILTALTLFLGTNPMGEGPRLWLGCCGVYFQPSEPLKLLLVVYLAAYLADRQPYLAFAGTRPSRVAPLLPLLAPTLVMIGLVLLLLFAQRDLGTASIFIILYAVVVFVASGNVRILLLSVLLLVGAGAAGYFLFDIVQQRIDAWLNPWIDPSGGSYQIVQSLIAIANGGITGRGPGLGSPGVIPIAHSDFIFSAITEESGLIGALGLLIILALFASRGIRIALRAEDSFRRYLAAGLVAHIVIQSLLIIAGNIRLLPLTGVTLPFVSYGGSSLLTSYLSLLLLILISKPRGKTTTPIIFYPYQQVGTWLMLGLGAAGLVTGWWAVFRAPALITRTDNPRRSISDRFVRRGALLTRRDFVVNESILESGEYTRVYQYPDLGPITGYNNPIYGSSGLEDSLDPYLRGTVGNPILSVWWNRLLYGQPPPGSDIRLSLDLDLQHIADGLLSGHRGALVLLNAGSGEILVMASHPTFNANILDDDWENLVQDEEAPLLDRSALGLYPIGAATGPFILAQSSESDTLPVVPTQLSYELDGTILNCASQPVGKGWGDVISAGCPNPVAILGSTLGEEAMRKLYENLGFYSPPQIRLPTISSPPVNTIQNPESASLGFMGDPTDLENTLLVSPLQMAIAAGSLSNHGIQPAPRLAVAYHTTQSEWVILPPLSQSSEVFSPQTADNTTASLAHIELPAWQSLVIIPNEPESYVTWYMGGTLSDWQGSPLAIVLVLEEDAPSLVEEIGQTILRAATQSTLP